jgi:hypothetical protein
MIPTPIADTSPVVTATMTSSNSATPAAVCPDLMRASPTPMRPNAMSCASPKRYPIRAA